jgi:hypothetical protein
MVLLAGAGTAIASSTDNDAGLVPAPQAPIALLPGMELIDFESDVAGPKPNGWQSVDSANAFFTDSLGADLYVADYGAQGDGQSLTTNPDDSSFLIIDFAIPMKSISMDFGNDDPFWTAPGDYAELRLFHGGNFVGSAQVVMNRNDIMDQTIALADAGCFDSAHFEYVVTVPTPPGTDGLIELVDNIAFEPCVLFKAVTSGNDVDGDGAIDKVVEVGIESAAEYSFSINYDNPGGPVVVILDTVPAEWRVNNILEGGVLFFSEDGSDTGLWILDTATGEAYAVGISGVTGQTVGLALSDDPGVLWGSKPFDMLAISKDGSGAAIVGGAVAEGLTYNPDNGKLYGAINGLFFEVSTGDFTTTIPLAAPGNDIEGLAYAGDGLIYGLSSFSGPRGVLYSYDIDSDTWTEIGFTGVEFREAGLAYDATRDVLYAKGDQDTFLYEIDPYDATASVIGDTEIVEGGGLTFDGAGLNCDFASANKKDTDKSATKITCWPATDSGSVIVDVEARCHDKRNNQKCRPTSCGALYLNDGAKAYALDEFGDPIYPPIAVSNSLCLAAVEDVDEDGFIDFTGAGDEDGDGLSDYEEACGACPSDPCTASDADGDGVADSCDNCPDVYNPGQEDRNGDGIGDACSDECAEAFTCGENAADYECYPGAGAGCFCVESIEGGLFCHTTQACSGTVLCSSSDECGPDEGCLINHCCNGGEGTCLNVSICLDPAAPAAAAAAGGPTSASL